MGITESKTTLAWRWCCQQPEFTRRQLQEVAEMTQSNSNHVVRAWYLAGAIERVDRKSNAFIYRVVDPQNPPALGKGSNNQPRGRAWRKTQQQKMWNSMKIGRAFALQDLMLTCDVSNVTASNFVEKLVRAGYVRVLQRKQSRMPIAMRIPARFQLIRDTGRFAPMKRPDGFWDQNEQRLYAFEVEGADSEQGAKHVQLA